MSTSWERLYFFTQGGNLMCQPRGAVAGGLIQDLDNCSVMAVDCEDRRYCFQITAPNGKSYASGWPGTGPLWDLGPSGTAVVGSHSSSGSGPVRVSSALGGEVACMS